MKYIGVVKGCVWIETREIGVKSVRTAGGKDGG